MSGSISLEWFKSSYSDEDGQACLEVAHSWRKSSYSGSEGGECLEVTAQPTTIHIRDSKDPERGHLTLTPATWTAFLALPLNHRA
ncbi:DUF397 domain-containing protein [Streptomyces sp. NRRL B-1347]|uniref:DUF397 domain-containing protein n=1 Tax=Streptomyces sp. NRRL B-1347 TaxID=1476877 RepID=UPI0004CACAEB|nr:DUF397 domain-containing protein [Streptomyces sp. NRRL B-1347]